MLEGVSSDLQPNVSHAYTRGSQAVHLRRLRQRILSKFRPQKTRPKTARWNADAATTTIIDVTHEASSLSARGAPGTALGWTGPQRVRPGSVLPAGGCVCPGRGTPRAPVRRRWDADDARGADCDAASIGGRCRSASQQSGDGVCGRTTAVSSHLVVHWITLLLLLTTTTTIIHGGPKAGPLVAVSQKKLPLKLCPIFCQMLTDFRNFCTKTLTPKNFTIKTPNTH